MRRAAGDERRGDVRSPAARLHDRRGQIVQLALVPTTCPALTADELTDDRVRYADSTSEAPAQTRRVTEIWCIDHRFDDELVTVDAE
ncbi:MAG TPA: hypothetical protein VN936_06545 [Candidatus Acidoferrum sp.]|nr:hypothetical protein [Candidatus Acidoferrum sp.]